MRFLLAALLGIAVASFIVLAEPSSWLLALPATLLAFLLGAAKGAVDLIDLNAPDLIADAAVLVAGGIAFSRLPSGDLVLTGTLLVAALTLQALPLAVRLAAR